MSKITFSELEKALEEKREKSEFDEVYDHDLYRLVGSNNVTKGIDEFIVQTSDGAAVVSFYESVEPDSLTVDIVVSTSPDLLETEEDIENHSKKYYDIMLAIKGL